MTVDTTSCASTKGKPVTIYIWPAVSYFKHPSWVLVPTDQPLTNCSIKVALIECTFISSMVSLRKWNTVWGPGQVGTVRTDNIQQSLPPLAMPLNPVQDKELDSPISKNSSVSQPLIVWRYIWTHPFFPDNVLSSRQALIPRVQEGNRQFC